jgi:hypothetical protein
VSAVFVSALVSAFAFAFLSFSFDLPFLGGTSVFAGAPVSTDSPCGLGW